MASYEVAQLGVGWAVFRVDTAKFGHVCGPYRSKRQAMSELRALRARVLETRRETLTRGIYRTGDDDESRSRRLR